MLSRLSFARARSTRENQPLTAARPPASAEVLRAAREPEAGLLLHPDSPGVPAPLFQALRRSHRRAAALQQDMRYHLGCSRKPQSRPPSLSPAQPIHPPPPSTLPP